MAIGLRLRAFRLSNHHDRESNERWRFQSASRTFFSTRVRKPCLGTHPDLRILARGRRRRHGQCRDVASDEIVEAEGHPDEPAAWIHRVAKNRILDSLRREKYREKALAFPERSSESQNPGEQTQRVPDDSNLSDDLLRMMFVCCHPILDRKSQIALTLKILCGFSVIEIARGLLMSRESAKKRIQRAKTRLADAGIEIEFPAADQLTHRLSVVHDVLYLMFNEGYSTSQGLEPIRDDVCEEAARLCHMLCEHPLLSTPESRALLSLMLFHASRLSARRDTLGNIVLLEDQDRRAWDHRLIERAHYWLIRSVEERPSRFHFEAVIAQYHCSAPSFEETDWERIILFYDRLQELFPSPIYRLNRAIAISQTGRHTEAIDELDSIRQSREMNDYYLLDVRGRSYPCG